MRESEEYLESSQQYINEGHLIEEGFMIPKDDAEHAVKLAYKEGYLEAIDDCMSRLTGYTELESHDIEEMLDEIREDFNKKQ